MEAVKPKKKHKKRTKGIAFQSPQRDQEVHDVEENSLNNRPDDSEVVARTETSKDATFESAEKVVLPGTSGITEINTAPDETTINSTLGDSRFSRVEGPQESKNQTNELFRAENRVDVAENSKESYDGAATNSGILDARFVTSTSVAPCLDGNGHETRFGPTGRESLELDSTENEIDHNQKTTAAKEIEQSDIHVPIKDLQRTEEKKCVESSELCSSDRALGNDKSGNVPKDATAERSNAEASPVYPNLDSLTRETASSTSQYRVTLEAFTEDYLKTFYFNPLLEQMEGFVDHFIQMSKQEDHEFYELVNTYFKGRNALAMAFKEYEIVLAECEKKKEQVWITKDLTLTAQGRCLDQVTVTHNHNYQQVELNSSLIGEMENSFKTMQKALHETLALQKYTCQMARLHIDMYIHDMLQHSALLRSVASDMLVTELCPADMSPELQGELQKLRDCISVLFMFVRQPIQDDEFVQIVNGWIEQLVAVLLRVASLADLVFLMNHVMRCPPGFPNKIARLIQFPMPQFKGQGYSSVGEHHYWDNPLVHHFVAMLAAVLRPIREREEFLEKLNVGKKATMRSISWTLVDEDGESLEDEDPETSWVLIQESDLIAVFSQFPFDAIFKHLLKMDPNISNDCLSESHYHVEHSTSRDVMRMVAFGSCVVYIMGNAFHTYRKIRYRGFVKRVGRTIRQVVQYVLDHWSGYRSWRVNVCGETENSSADVYTAENQVSLKRLQVEVDQFFLRAALQIISAHRLGAWQFLADMPFSSVSSGTLWKLLWALHSDIAKLESVANIQSEEAFRDDWREELHNRCPEFCDQLANMTQSEAIFLLTTFANMAISRNEKEREFIEAISLEVYEVSFIAVQTRELCSKTGRHLLGTVTAVHPFVLSVLLERVSETISIIGKACVYLFTGLSVHLWHPTYKNMDCIRSWLLKADLSSPEHQLARYVVSNLNWGHVGEPGESDKLFLHKCLHRAMAVTLVEVSALRLPNLPGGISHEAFREDNSLLKQVTMLAASSYSRMTQPGYEQQVYDWLWEVMLILRLHAADLPTPVMQFTQALPNEEELQASDDSGPGMASLVKALSSGSLELSSVKALTNMCHAIKAGGPLACYAAVSMTTIGASHDLFLDAGLEHMTTIMNEKCYGAVFKIVANVVPLFFGCPEKLTQEARFASLIHRLSQLDNDNAGYAEKLLQASTAGEYCKRLSGIIHSHVQKFQVPGTKGPICVLEFWMQTLCSLPNWYRDVSVQFLLDNVIKSAMRVEGGLGAIQTRLMNAYKVVLKESGGQGVIASILSWVTSSGSAPPVLWDIKATPDYSYYAYSVLCNETQLEEDSGFSVELSRQLLKKPRATIEAALRKVVKVMKLTWHPLLSQLSIYRWANQALLTDMDHPMLPLIWQRFFSLYLQRPVTQPGLAQRAGVGYRFFDSSMYLSMLKKMKQRLHATAERHRNKSMDVGADRDTLRDGDNEITKQFEHVRAFHGKLTGYYQTLALWLDEPRLHDPSLFLPSLPPPYDPTRLETLLKPEQVPWIDLLYTKKIDWELMESVRCWVKQALGPHRKPVNSQMTGQWSDRDPETAASRIIRRMKIHPPTLSPPPVTKPQRILPQLLDGTLMNRQKLLNIVYTQILGLVAQARKLCGFVNHHISLDIEYIDLVPKMYSNETSQDVVQVPCRSKFFKDGNQCRGPATLTITFMAKRINEVTVRKIAENRNEQEQVIKNFIQPCPSSLCEAAAYVEIIITSLVNKAKASTERKTQEILNDIGTGLFYQISGMVDDNVLNYQPTVQFFTLCIEILGKAFILHNGSQTEQLLSAILEHTSVTMLLVPFFCPNDNPASFSSLYQRILDTADGDLVFSLLSKFDVQQWLSSTGSNFNERRVLITAVFSALNALGYEPTDKQKLILDMYLRHLSIAVMYNFPEQYGDALRQLCEGSSKRTLCLDVWNMFLSCIGCVLCDGSEPHNPSMDILGDEQVLETLSWLTKYFNDQRADLGGHVTGGLYTMWRPYIKQLSFILGFMCQQIVVRRAAVVYARKGQGLERALGELWSLICSVFHPWMCSQESPIPGNPPVAPWTESEVPQASDMVALYTDSLGCLHSHFNAPHSSTSIMNMFWHYFVSSLAKEGIPDYVLRVYHSKFFQLPWESFFPTLQNMQLMQELYSLCKSSFRFLGIVFPRFDWNNIVAAYCENQTNEAISLLHASLFHLLVMFSNEKSVMEVQGSEMPALLDNAQSFAWHYLDGRSFDHVVSWQVEHCSVASVLQERSCGWFALRLIRAAAGIVLSDDGSMQASRPDTAAKRASYVRCVASLLCACSTSKNHEAKSYSTTVLFVLKDIESVAGSGCDPANTASEVCMMMSEALNMLNNCSPVGDALSIILNVILQFIRDSSCTMLVLASLPAACRTLASIKFMVSVVETGIQSFFAKHSTPVGTAHAATDAVEDGGWGQIVPDVAVPDLAQDEFVQECIRQGALLTLYTNVLQKLAACQSPHQEMTILSDMFTWSLRLKVRPAFEWKLLLFWHKILQLSLRQVLFASGPLNELTKQLSFLASHLHSLGEDKDSSGLFGAIGFGKKSCLSVKFRFICRALECFLLAQMPSNSLLRLEAKAPGYVREPKSTRQLTADGRAISSTAEAEQALASLESLRSHKLYNNLTEHILTAYSFIANPLHSLKDGPQFVANLVRRLFPDEKALLIVA